MIAAIDLSQRLLIGDETSGARAPAPALPDLAAAALRCAASLDLPVVLEQVAQEVRGLLGGVCQVRFAPPRRPADARWVVVGPHGPPHAASGVGSSETYIALVAQLSDQAQADSGAALLFAPLVARGRRLGAIDLVVLTAPDFDIGRAQHTLRALAAHAALAIDSADQVAQLRQPAGVIAGEPIDADHSPLLSLIAHDLRDPLTALSASIQLLVRAVRGAQELSREKIARLADLADASVARIETQISTLIPSRAGGVRGREPNDQPVDLVELARLMVSFYQQTSDQLKITLVAAAPALPGPWARPHMERVIGNLLTNAIKYSSPGSTVRLTIDHEIDTLGEWALLSIENQGVGIPGADLARIGQPGYRAQNVGAVAGTGFGLASVRAVVEQYGGRLTLQSALDATTIVQVRLPLGW